MKIELKNAIGRLILLCSLPNIKVARINPCTPLQKGLRSYKPSTLGVTKGNHELTPTTSFLNYHLKQKKIKS